MDPVSLCVGGIPEGRLVEAAPEVFWTVVGILVAFWADGVIDGTAVDATELTPVVRLARMATEWLGFSFIDEEVVPDNFTLFTVGVSVWEGFNEFVYVD